MNDIRNYDDIIDLPRHVSKRHKAMPLLNRAAQFAPFAALTGHSEAIDETARPTENKVELVNDRMEHLDKRLNQLRRLMTTPPDSRPPVTITHFSRDARKEGGSYKTVKAIVKAIDETDHYLALVDGTRIAIEDIVDLTITE